MGSEQCVGPGVEKKPPSEQEITLNKKTKTTESPARAKYFYAGYLGKKALHISLCTCKVQVPAKRNVAEGDLILITAFSRPFDVFTSCVGFCWLVGWLVLGFWLVG